MNAADLSQRYRDYIACLNRQNWETLGDFVSPDVRHNDRPLGLSGYRRMLEGNYLDIPDLHFGIALLVCTPPHVAARLQFDCTPVGRFLGLDIDGRRVSFTENVFYRFQHGRVEAVWSLVDRDAIAAQLGAV